MPADVTLYHSPLCPFARRVRFVLEHLEVPYDAIEVDLKDPPQDFRSISPYGLVPAINHNGENLYESNIINEYLDEVYQGGLMPDDPLEKARVRILMDYADTYWQNAVHGLKKATREGAPKTEVRERQQELLKRLREIEVMFVGSGPYLRGPALSLADVAFSATVVELPKYGMHVPDALTRTKRWENALKELPAMQRIPGEPDLVAKKDQEA